MFTVGLYTSQHVRLPSAGNIRDYQHCQRRNGSSEGSAGATGSGNRFVVARVDGARLVADLDANLLVRERLHRALIQQLVHAVTEHDVS